MPPAFPSEQPRLIEFLEPVIGPGFASGDYTTRFHRAVHRRAYEAWLAGGTRPPMMAGRVLRILGRPAEARKQFAAALLAKSEPAAAYAWRWELERSASLPFSGGGIDRAIALEPGRAQWLLMKGADALSRGKRDAARKSLEAALSLKGAPALAHALMGTLSQPRKRIAHLDQAVRLEPETSWFYKLRADARVRSGDAAGALADIDLLMLREEGSRHLHVLSGRPQQHERPETLLPWLDRFLAKSPVAWALVLRANLRRHKSHNDYGQALRDLEDAVKLAPDYAWAWAYLARARGLAKAPRAQEAFDEAARLAPDCGWITAWRGELRRLKGDFAGAVADLDRALALHPYYTMAYVSRGAARRALGQNEAASADLDIALELEPDYGWVYYERMQAHRARGRFAEALEDLCRAHRLDSKFALARTHEELPQAVSDMGEVLRLDPKNWRAYAWRGEVKIRLGDHAGAAADLDRAVALGGEHAWTRRWRGRARAALGLSKEALVDFKRAIVLEPEDPDAYAEAAVIHREKGRPREALKTLTLAVKKARASVWIRSLKGQLELALGRHRLARADFDAALVLAPPPFEAAFEPLLGRAASWLAAGSFENAGRDLEAAARLRQDPAQTARLDELRAALEKKKT